MSGEAKFQHVLELCMGDIESVGCETSWTKENWCSGSGDMMTDVMSHDLSQVGC